MRHLKRLLARLGHYLLRLSSDRVAALDQTDRQVLAIALFGVIATATEEHRPDIAEAIAPLAVKLGVAQEVAGYLREVNRIAVERN